MRKPTSCCPAANSMFREPRNYCQHPQADGRGPARRGFSRLTWRLSSANDPEFRQFPPHCLKGTPGAELVPEALTENFVRVENDSKASLPDDLRQYQQVILEKQTLDIFASKHADELVGRLGSAAEFVVFGVVTEYCVSFAVKGLLQRKRRSP